jgi:hypothetical protein
VRDFVWWSGLTMADAKRGVDIVRARSETIDGLTYWRVGPRPAIAPPRDVVHLLPVYDEYLVAYRDLAAVPRGNALWGLLPPAVVSAGQVIGTWKVARGPGSPKVAINLGRKPTAAERQQLERAIARYTHFAGAG